MESRFRAKDRNQIEFELTLTMSLEDWRTLQEQLKTIKNIPYPAWHIGDAIDKMVRHAYEHWMDADE